MKIRVVTSVALVLGLVVVLFAIGTIFFDITLALIALVGIYEICMAFKLAGKQKNILLFGLAPLVISLFLLPSAYTHLLPAVAVATLIYFAICFVFSFPDIEFKTFAAVLTFSALTTLSFFSWKGLKMLFPPSDTVHSVYFIIIGIAYAWGSDTFAYLAGMLFGNHKLAPKLSPKKTVEGLVGGIFGGIFLAELVTYIFFSFFIEATFALYIIYIAVAGVGAFATLLGVVGDLFASAIKRQVNIKDYGKIFPGHGGVLDRFDSLLFVMPLVLCFAYYYASAAVPA